MASKEMSLGSATIGPASWRNKTLKEIKLSKSAVQRCNTDLDRGRATDPLPQLRTVLNELSNHEAHEYFRQTRAVVCKLRESVVYCNEEIKAMTRAKESLEKLLEHIRKDQALNSETQEKRKCRPRKEQVSDGADDLLRAEKIHLVGMKRFIETQLREVLQHLQVLDASRRRMTAALNERSRIMELICSTIAPCSPFSPHNPLNSSRNNPLSRSAGGQRCVTPMPPVDPLGAFTPEVEQALQEAEEVQAKSVALRGDVAALVERTNSTMSATHRSVNQGLARKCAETIQLKQDLELARGLTNQSLSRAERWYEATNTAWEHSKGPVCSTDLTASEKLDRPIMKVAQRHPGHDMPEAQQIIKGGQDLLKSLRSTSRHIGSLKLAQLRLKDEIKDKTAAMDIDSNIMRLRRRKGNHRWMLYGAGI